MANYFARKAGNINAADVWATTPSGSASDVWSTFTSADVLHSNNFAVTVNVDTTVGEVRFDNANGATQGGSFTLSNGVTLTSNVVAGANTTNAGCVNVAVASPNSAAIVGDCTGGATNTNAVRMTGTGTLTSTGVLTGGSAFGGQAVRNTTTGSLTVVGNCFGGTGAEAVSNLSTGILTITGDCTGGNGAVGANNASTGTMTIVGTINASEFASGVGGANRSQTTLLTGPFIASTTFGVNPIGCLAWRWADSLNDQTYITVPTSDLLATRNLVTPDNATNFPDEADVKDGVSYGIGGALTGTFEQTVAPDPADIATAVWSAATSSLTTSGSIGERLKNTATVSTTGEQLAAALTAP